MTDPTPIKPSVVADLKAVKTDAVAEVKAEASSVWSSVKRYAVSAGIGAVAGALLTHFVFHL